MRLLVTGSEGMLGRAVMRGLADQHELCGVARADGDLTKEGVAAALLAVHRPEWVLHCAAWTDVDGAETAEAAAAAVNVDATARLGAACAALGVGLTLVSTDYVFDGEAAMGYAEDHPRHPVNYYGLTKARAEEVVEKLVTPWQIVRTSWLFGDGKVNFVKTMRRLLQERESLRVVDDQIGCPTGVDDLAVALGYLIDQRLTGIFHVTNHGATTWCGLAREVARCLGADSDRIEPCASSEYPTVAARPTQSTLLDTKLSAAGCPRLPSWQDAVGRYVDELAKGSVVFP